MNDESVLRLTYDSGVRRAATMARDILRRGIYTVDRQSWLADPLTFFSIVTGEGEWTRLDLSSQRPLGMSWLQIEMAVTIAGRLPP